MTTGIDSTQHDLGGRGFIRPPLFLIVAGLVLAALGIIRSVMSVIAAHEASTQLNIRAAIESENGTMNAFAPSYTWAWVWGTVAAIGILLIVAGLVRRASGQRVTEPHQSR